MAGFLLHEVSSQIHRDRKENGGGQGLWEGVGELVFNMYSVSFGEDEKVLELNSGDCCPAIRMYLMAWSCALKNG